MYTCHRKYLNDIIISFSGDRDLFKLGRLIVIPSLNDVTQENIDKYGLITTAGYRIHIFVDSVKFNKPEFIQLIATINPGNHIYFHIWKNLIDFIRLAEASELMNCHPKLRIVHENPKCDIRFRIMTIPSSYNNEEDSQYKDFLTIRYHDECGTMYNSCEVVISSKHRHIAYYAPYIDVANPVRDSFPIRSMATRENPELFKDDIIRRFKDVTPDGILKTFKDDDDIWSFITEQNR